MSDKFYGDVQRIVLHGTRWNAARHLMLKFGKQSPLRFLNLLLQEGWPTPSNAHKHQLQCSLGFTRRGLKGAGVPDPLLSLFALKAPAYSAGAQQRAAEFMALTGRNAAELWPTCFHDTELHAVLSLHGMDLVTLTDVFEKLRRLALDQGIAGEELPLAETLPTPPGQEEAKPETPGQWVHFGFRDGLSRIGIEGYTRPHAMEQLSETSRHKAGEFLLGHVADCGSDPWVMGPLGVLPDKLRDFFHNGSFGVLQQIEQDVDAFEAFVKAHEAKPEFAGVDIKGKLCGRYADGRPMVDPGAKNIAADFDFKADAQGLLCPFGSHVRRMNPRVPTERPKTEAELLAYPAQFSQPRPVLRRGLPYGPSWHEGAPRDTKRGLIGQFFCASIENQFEHLLSQWADRVPMGSPDPGGARDPIMGAHEPADRPFEIPRDGGQAPLKLKLPKPLTQTIGTAYLFYPSLSTLQGIADSSLWGLDDQDQQDGGT